MLWLSYYPAENDSSPFTVSLEELVGHYGQRYAITELSRKVVSFSRGSTSEGLTRRLSPTSSSG